MNDLTQIPDINKVTRLAAITINVNLTLSLNISEEFGHYAALVLGKWTVKVGETQNHRPQPKGSVIGQAIALTGQFTGPIRRDGEWRFLSRSLTPCIDMLIELGRC